MDYRHMTVIGQHEKAAWGLAMNNAEAVLVSGGNDTIIQAYELSTFKPLTKFKAKGPISSLALSNSADELYVSSKIRKEIAIFTLDGNYVGSLEGGQPGVQSLLIHPDGKKLISRSGNSLVTLWDLDTRQQLASVEEPGFTEVQSMAISEDGSTLAIGGTGIIYLCGLADMATSNTLGDSSLGMVKCLEFHGDLLYSCGLDNLVKEWDMKTLKLKRTFVAPDVSMVTSANFQERFICMELIPERNLLLLGSVWGAIYTYDMTTGQVISMTTTNDGAPVLSLRYNPEGDVLIRSDGTGNIAYIEIDQLLQVGRL